eukprot:EG_transcript_12514
MKPILRPPQLMEPIPSEALLVCRQKCDCRGRAGKVVGCSIAAVAVLCYMRAHPATFALLASPVTGSIIRVTPASPTQIASRLPLHIHGRIPLRASSGLEEPVMERLRGVESAQLEELPSPSASQFQRCLHGLAVAMPFLFTFLGIKRQQGDEGAVIISGDAADDRSLSRPLLFGLGILAGVCIFPAVGYAAQAVTPGLASNVAMTFGTGFAQAFSLIFFSEIGDKTFFIAGLLAVKYGKVVSYCGSMAALVAMSVVAVLMGQVFHAVPPSLTNGLPLDDYAATLLFAYFGFQAIREHLCLCSICI